MKAIGQFAEGAAAMDAGKFTRKVMRINSRNALQDSTAEQGRLRDTARISIGKQLAGLASSGFDPSSGSALDALHASAIGSELEIMGARRRGQLQAEGLRVQGDLAYNEGYSKMVGSTLSGVASLMDSAAKMGGGE